MTLDLTAKKDKCSPNLFISNLAFLTYNMFQKERFFSLSSPQIISSTMWFSKTVTRLVQYH